MLFNRARSALDALGSCGRWPVTHRSPLIEPEDRDGRSPSGSIGWTRIAAAHFKIKGLESATASLRARGARLAAAEQVIENLREILTTFDK